MPECFLRYHTTTFEIYEASFQPITTGVAANEATASIGEQAMVPDARTTRYNGSGGLRAATPTEILNADAVRRDREAAVNLDTMQVAAALAVEVWLEINALRAAAVPPLPAVSPATWRQRWIDRYKALVR